MAIHITQENVINVEKMAAFLVIGFGEKLIVVAVCHLVLDQRQLIQEKPVLKGIYMQLTQSIALSIEILV